MTSVGLSPFLHYPSPELLQQSPGRPLCSWSYPSLLHCSPRTLKRQFVTPPVHKPLSGLPLKAEPQLLTMLRAALGVWPQLSLCPPQRTLQSHQHSSSAKPSFVSPLSILFPLPRTLSCVSLMSLLLGSPPEPPKYRLGATAHVLLQYLLSRLSRSFSHYV